MLVILSFLLYSTICCAIEQSIVSRIDLNEPLLGNHIQFDEGTASPNIDPNILEDANLTTVILIIFKAFPNKFI